MRRCEKNPRYSLRAFAKSLGSNHATVSSILAGKRPLTQKTVSRFCAALHLSPDETTAFLKFTPARKNANAASSHPIAEYRELTLDAFISVSEWYHDAILELTRIQSFRPETRWIGKVLGVNPSQISAAVERLVRLELLEITSDGKWLDLSRSNTTNIHDDFTAVALRKYQKKVLELSMNALETLPRTERDHTSMTVAMQQSDLAEVKERIRKFRFELTAFLEREGAVPDSVHQLAVSFFPLTDSEKMKGSL